MGSETEEGWGAADARPLAGRKRKREELLPSSRSASESVVELLDDSDAEPPAADGPRARDAATRPAALAAPPAVAGAGPPAARRKPAGTDAAAPSGSIKCGHPSCRTGATPAFASYADRAQHVRESHLEPGNWELCSACPAEPPGIVMRVRCSGCGLTTKSSSGRKHGKECRPPPHVPHLLCCFVPRVPVPQGKGQAARPCLHPSHMLTEVAVPSFSTLAELQLHVRLAHITELPAGSRKGLSLCLSCGALLPPAATRTHRAGCEPPSRAVDDGFVLVAAAAVQSGGAAASSSSSSSNSSSVPTAGRSGLPAPAARGRPPKPAVSSSAAAAGRGVPPPLEEEDDDDSNEKKRPHPWAFPDASSDDSGLWPVDEVDEPLTASKRAPSAGALRRTTHKAATAASSSTSIRAPRGTTAATVAAKQQLQAAAAKPAPHAATAAGKPPQKAAPAAKPLPQAAAVAKPLPAASPGVAKPLQQAASSAAKPLSQVSPSAVMPLPVAVPAAAKQAPPSVKPLPQASLTTLPMLQAAVAKLLPLASAAASPSPAAPTASTASAVQSLSHLASQPPRAAVAPAAPAPPLPGGPALPPWAPPAQVSWQGELVPALRPAAAPVPQASSSSVGGAEVAGAPATAAGSARPRPKNTAITGNRVFFPGIVLPRSLAPTLLRPELLRRPSDYVLPTKDALPLPLPLPPAPQRPASFKPPAKPAKSPAKSARRELFLAPDFDDVGEDLQPRLQRLAAAAAPPSIDALDSGEETQPAGAADSDTTSGSDAQDSQPLQLKCNFPRCLAAGPYPTMSALHAHVCTAHAAAGVAWWSAPVVFSLSSDAFPFDRATALCRSCGAVVGSARGEETHAACCVAGSPAVGSPGWLRAPLPDLRCGYFSAGRACDAPPFDNPSALRSHVAAVHAPGWVAHDAAVTLAPCLCAACGTVLRARGGSWKSHVSHCRAFNSEPPPQLVWIDSLLRCAHPSHAEAGQRVAFATPAALRSHVAQHATVDMWWVRADGSVCAGMCKACGYFLPSGARDMSHDCCARLKTEHADLVHGAAATAEANGSGAAAGGASEADASSDDGRSTANDDGLTATATGKPTLPTVKTPHGSSNDVGGRDAPAQALSAPAAALAGRPPAPSSAEAAAKQHAASAPPRPGFFLDLHFGPGSALPLRCGYLHSTWASRFKAGLQATPEFQTASRGREAFKLVFFADRDRSIKLGELPSDALVDVPLFELLARAGSSSSSTSTPLAADVVFVECDEGGAEEEDPEGEAEVEVEEEPAPKPPRLLPLPYPAFSVEGRSAAAARLHQAAREVVETKEAGNVGVPEKKTKAHRTSSDSSLRAPPTQKTVGRSGRRGGGRLQKTAQLAAKASPPEVYAEVAGVPALPAAPRHVSFAAGPPATAVDAPPLEPQAPPLLASGAQHCAYIDVQLGASALRVGFTPVTLASRVRASLIGSALFQEASGGADAFVLRLYTDSDRRVEVQLLGSEELDSDVPLSSLVSGVAFDGSGMGSADAPLVADVVFC